VIIAGEPTVGKTQLIHQATTGTFNHNYMMTQGCEYSVKDVKLEDKLYQHVELHIIDLAGQIIFKEITYDLMCKANQLILVYDNSNPDSFQHLRTWYEQIKSQNLERTFTGVVIANKTDLESQVVSPDDGSQFAQQIGFEFFECSAMQSKCIEEPFKALAQMHYDRYQEKIAMLD